MTPNANAPLTDAQVDQLADILDEQVKAAKSVRRISYRLAHDSSRKLGIITGYGLPREGLTTAASFGLAHEDWTHAGFSDRFEFVQARDNPADEYERIVVAVAEGSISSRKVPKAGMIYADAVVSARLPELAKRMPHATLVFPYSWQNFSSADLRGGVKVWFMQVVPIYEVERKYLQQHGFAAFEQLIVEQGAHFHKLDREPYVAGT
ncbi:MAG TPA: suppressor of fused domain protein [Polyangiaceae bacterium]|nr:suppressor of fused domain protein [Polyangiaceae bacterium]